MIAMPLVLVLLVLIFGGVVAASMPVLIGVLSVVGALSVTRVIALFSDVESTELTLSHILRAQYDEYRRMQLRWASQS